MGAMANAFFLRQCAAAAVPLHHAIDSIIRGGAMRTFSTLLSFVPGSKEKRGRSLAGS